jgi:peptide deformylase
MEIYQHPYETLAVKSTEVNLTDFTLDLPDDDLERFEYDLCKMMVTYGGIGLAANQIGITKRFFAIGHNYFLHFKKPRVIWNPKIIKSDTNKTIDQEGCLSFRGLLVKVERPRMVKVEYTNTKHEKCHALLDGIESKCFQHELDHLDGITMKDRVSKLRWQLAKKYKVKKKLLPYKE